MSQTFSQIPFQLLSDTERPQRIILARISSVQSWVCFRSESSSQTDAPVAPSGAHLCKFSKRRRWTLFLGRLRIKLMLKFRAQEASRNGKVDKQWRMGLGGVSVTSQQR